VDLFPLLKELFSEIDLKRKARDQDS